MQRGQQYQGANLQALLLSETLHHFRFLQMKLDQTRASKTKLLFQIQEFLRHVVVGGALALWEPPPEASLEPV